MAEKTHYPRALAVRILTRVLSDHVELDEALSSVAESMMPASRAWLQEVCSGTLRWKGRLDLVLDSTALKKKPSGWLRKILLIAAYQLVVQERTPAALVVAETVDEVRKKEGTPPSQFANACLRKIADHAATWRELGFQPQNGAAWASLPDWLWKTLVKEYGLDWARSYAESSLQRPSLWIRSRDADWHTDWAEAGPLPCAWRGTEGGAIPLKKGFQEGEFFIQDISSQKLVAEISREVHSALGVPQAGKWSALDLCAAPGGKAVGMAWSGFQVRASDRESGRLELLRQTLSRVAPEVVIVPQEEVLRLPVQDLVWVDAPCSGTGILRRHPDVRWLRRESDLPGMLKLQQELLEKAWKLVRPGGFLAYSVCSVLKSEGSGALENSGLALRGQKIREWSLFPHEAPNGDGFWGVLLRKTLDESSV